MFRWLKSAWYAHLRGIDMKILWTACRSQAPDLDHAKAAFAMHALHDPAWLYLGENRIKEFIDSLE